VQTQSIYHTHPDFGAFPSSIMRAVRQAAGRSVLSAARPAAARAAFRAAVRGSGSDRSRRLAAAALCCLLTAVLMLGSLLLPVSAPVNLTASETATDPTSPPFSPGIGLQTRQAYAVTSAEKQAEADEMMRRLDELQTELNQINADYSAAVEQHADALLRMQDAQQREADADARIAELQTELGARAQSMYRNGPTTYLDVIFGAKTFTEFINNMDMMNRLNSHDADLVAESKIVREDAEAARIEYTELERVTAEKETEITNLKAQKDANAIEMMAQIDLLQTQAAELLAQEILEAEQARQRARENSGLTDDQIIRVPEIANPLHGGYNWERGFGYSEWDGTFHQGVDLSLPTGSPVYASAPGTVTSASYLGSMGNCVIINHGSGVRTIYMHNSELLVSPGEEVARGDMISLSGNTGNSSGPHLHFQLEIDGVAVDPTIFCDF